MITDQAKIISENEWLAFLRRVPRFLSRVPWVLRDECAEECGNLHESGTNKNKRPFDLHRMGERALEEPLFFSSSAVLFSQGGERILTVISESLRIMKKK